MKFKFIKAKTIFAIGLVCMTAVGTVGASANTELCMVDSSDTREIINTFPAESIVQERVGFSPKYVDSFSNGFKFNSFNSSHSELKDDSKNTITSIKSAEFIYKRDGAAEDQDLTFSAEKVEEQYTDLYNFSDQPVEYNGVKIYYGTNKYKSVPLGYKVTAEEQKMINDGLLQIGYGDPSDKVHEDNSQVVAWYENGIEYNICNTNYDDLTKDKMIDMAKQVIDK